MDTPVIPPPPQAPVPPPPTLQSAMANMNLFMGWPDAMDRWPDYNDWTMVALIEQSMLMFSGISAWKLVSLSNAVTIPTTTIISPLSGGKITINSGTISNVYAGRKLYIDNVEFPLTSNITKTVSTGTLSDRDARRPDRIFLGIRIGDVLYTRAGTITSADFAMKTFDGALASSQDITSSVALNITPGVYDSDTYDYDAVNDEVEVLADGRYQISYSVYAYLSSPTDGGEARAWISLDTGGGFAAVSGSYAIGNMDVTYESTTLSMTRILELEAGDKIKIFAQRSEGVQTVYASSSGTALTIVKVK